MLHVFKNDIVEFNVKLKLGPAVNRQPRYRGKDSPFVRMQVQYKIIFNLNFQSNILIITVLILLSFLVEHESCDVQNPEIGVRFCWRWPVAAFGRHSLKKFLLGLLSER